MPSGDMLIKLFENFKNQDEEGFAQIAFDIIKEEQKKNHYLLADKLKRAMFSSGNNLNRSPKYINALGNLPKDKDNNTNLLDVKYANKDKEDIVLNTELFEKLDTIVEENIKSEILQTYGLNPKRKILLCGPPGCGKTLSVEVLSNLLSLPILYTRFDSVVSSYLGETATNLTKIFNFAEKGNWILFFDEFDAIGKSRDNHEEHGELKRVVNTFLQLLDNFESNSIIIAATNYEKLIDNALWRRFDDVIYFSKPEENEIKKMLKLNLRVFKYDFDVADVAKDMIGLSYSDIERVCKDSIKKTILNDKKVLRIETMVGMLEKEKERQSMITGFSE
jgi:SpoVK/Ycf46/Vps4 family AAA+-type ATPase